MDATELFLIRHQRLHAHVDALTDGLSEEQVRRPVHPLANPLAWLLWHLARSEDAAIGILVCDTPQVLDHGWSLRLNVGRRDVGTGMTAAEVLDLSARVDLPSLQAYWRAVGERTAGLVSSLRPSDLDEIVAADRVRRCLEQTVVGPAGPRLLELWKNATRGHFLASLPLTHNYEHAGQADLIRGLLGRPGRY